MHIDESKLKKTSPTRANETIIQTAIVNSKIPRESSNLLLKTPPTSPRNKQRQISPVTSPTVERPDTGSSDIPVSFIGGEEEPIDEGHVEKKRIEEETRCNVTLTKDPYSGIGISVSGGKDTSSEDITVRELFFQLVHKLATRLLKTYGFDNFYFSSLDTANRLRQCNRARWPSEGWRQVACRQRSIFERHDQPASSCLPETNPEHRNSHLIPT